VHLDVEVRHQIAGKYILEGATILLLIADGNT
jgi:hypothetical protein